MINYIVLMFSLTDEKAHYEQGENRTVMLFRRWPRDRLFIKLNATLPNLQLKQSKIRLRFNI